MTILCILQWLTDRFLPYLDEWEQSVSERKGYARSIIYGAVYWNVFGEGADVKKTVGEGFSFVDGECKWNSYTFNANSDAYHDGKRGISDLAKICVSKIINEWRETSQIGKTYSVKDLLSSD